MADEPKVLDEETLLGWTTAALVRYIAIFSTKQNPSPTTRANAELCARELNMRVPPRKDPT